jgi:hypothetical protein
MVLLKQGEKGTKVFPRTLFRGRARELSQPRLHHQQQMRESWTWSLVSFMSRSMMWRKKCCARHSPSQGWPFRRSLY